MKVLFFNAMAGHQKIASALADQVMSSLRPFNRFLSQAIHTAKQRQVRYQLPWERVRNLSSIRLEPVDSLLQIPRRLPGVVLTNWPEGRQPDLSQFGFVKNRSVLVQIKSTSHTVEGLSVQTDKPLYPKDVLVWGELDLDVSAGSDPGPPRKITDFDGRPLNLIAPAHARDEQSWLLRVEGTHRDCDLLVDGEEVEAEALSTSEGLHRVVDCDGKSFDVSDGMLRVEDLPSAGFLRGNNGVRYRWVEDGRSGRQGFWIQLLPPETSEADDFLDPRAAFCEGDVSEIWTQPRRSPNTTFRVKRIDQDRYQLQLDRLPADATTLYLPVDQRNLYLQKRALRQLAESPLPHHQGLLRLCENPERARWPKVHSSPISSEGWRALTDESRSGTTEQRSFVNKALGSPDFAFLEGPPGSGKTTAICEIVQQLVERGQRVLLCASTHVAIDNVLERLIESSSPIDAVRIGKLDKVDDNVQATQLDTRIESLVSAWNNQPTMREYGSDERLKMAERSIIMAANLTCGTTMGIVNHPLFRGKGEDMHISDRPISTIPHWDVLIVDEASKTLIQEFMVPALMAKRWIIVGDVRQLPPFADRADIVANLRDLVDENDKSIFPLDHQRACLLLFRLLQRKIRQPGVRWLLVEKPGVLEWISRELESELPDGLSVVRVVAHESSSAGAVSNVTAEQLRSGAVESLLVAAADWVLVGDDLLPKISAFLPSNLLFARDLSCGMGVIPEGSPLLLRQAWWLSRVGALQVPYKEKKIRREDVVTMADCQSCEADWLGRGDLAQELAWRLTRAHELRHSRNDREKSRLRDELNRLQPKSSKTKIKESLEEIEDIGLPSILEVLQDGIGVERSKRHSALTAGLRTRNKDEFESRFESLSYQHRMHSDIASFSREVIYEGHSLKDANTIQIRDEKLGWDFYSSSFTSRRVWAHVEGREKGNQNPDEVHAIERILRDFIAWVKEKGPPNRESPKVWEVACLCFYVKQEQALSKMLRELTRDDRKTRFQVSDAPVEIVCGTVDRFQGREADLVMLSMRNTRRVGFLDSPNRLNVAVTRARQQLVVVGNADYFRDCRISELQELVRLSPRVDEKDERRRRRSK